MTLKMNLEERLTTQENATRVQEIVSLLYNCVTNHYNHP
jgi:hypothetical protein